MESITPVMSAILRELVVIWSMVLTTCDTTAPPRAATSAADEAKSLAWREASALCCTVLVSTSIDEAASSRLAAVCSVRWLRSWLPVAISVLAVEMLPAASCTWCTRPRKDCCMRPMAATSWPTSSWFSACSSRERSPPAMRSARSRACASERVMERTLRVVSGISTARANTRATPIRPDMVAARVSTPWRASCICSRAEVARRENSWSVAYMCVFSRSA